MIHKLHPEEAVAVEVVVVEVVVVALNLEATQAHRLRVLVQKLIKVLVNLQLLICLGCHAHIRQAQYQVLLFG